MCVYEAHSGQNHDNKIALQVSFSLALQQILWTCCLFLSSINNTFFSVLVIIFSNMSYLFFCFFNYTNTFFIHTMNYFSVVLRIIFLMCIENYFFHWAENYFSRYREVIFEPTMLCWRCSCSGLVRVFGRFPFTRKFWKFWLVHQMERTISVWSDRDIRDQL